VKLSLVFCSIIAAGLIACAGSKEQPITDQSLTQCVPNQTFRCQCPDLTVDGSQKCTEDGQLTECICPKAPKAPKTDNSSTKPTPPPTTTTPPPPPPPPTSTCGDGNLDKGEACDDGNTVDGDGCSSQCKPDGAPAAAETCPGQALTLWQGSSLVLSGTTEGYTDDLQASCVPSPGPDRVYAIQPSADGFMQVDAVFGAGFDAIVEVRRDACDSPDAHVLCEDTFSTSFQRVVEVKAGHTYHVIVDGDAPDSAGAYTIRLDLN
jgi:cysteine-rich repeat protein